MIQVNITKFCSSYMQFSYVVLKGNFIFFNKKNICFLFIYYQVRLAMVPRNSQLIWKYCLEYC